MVLSWRAQQRFTAKPAARPGPLQRPTRAGSERTHPGTCLPAAETLGKRVLSFSMHPKHTWVLPELCVEQAAGGGAGRVVVLLCSLLPAGFLPLAGRVRSGVQGQQTQDAGR